MVRASFALFSILLPLTSGCRKSVQVVDADVGLAASSSILSPLNGNNAPDDDGEELLQDLLEPSPRCHIEHRGALIDLGSPEVAWASPGLVDATTDVAPFERDGTTFGRILDRRQTFTFAIDQTGPALVAMRGRARGAKKVNVGIDGKVVGTITLSTTEDKVVTASSPTLILTPGLHTVSLHWIGKILKDEPIAEVDWIRVGVSDADSSAYAAPTRRDAFAQVAMGGVPRKAFVLRAPAVLRCVVFVPEGARLRTDIAVMGEGTGQVALRVRNGLNAAEIISSGEAHAGRWSRLAAPLDKPDPVTGLTVLEIAVTKGPANGRVVLAEPRITRKIRKKPSSIVPNEPSIRRAKGAIIVVLAGYSGDHHVALPTSLSKEGVRFLGHRAPSRIASGSVASLVTGLPASVHALEDRAARLSNNTPLFGKMFAPFGIITAMFSEVPTTGPAFGFGHDFSLYAAKSPLDGLPTGLDELEKFKDTLATKRSVFLLHARGAHPPWEVAPEVLKLLPPESYSGPADPKHAVAVLAKARRGIVKLTEPDRVRLDALQNEALSAQLRRLGIFLETLRAEKPSSCCPTMAGSTNLLDDLLIVVTSDVPFVLPNPAPTPTPSGAKGLVAVQLSDLEPEDTLGIPLVVRFPDAAMAGREVHTLTDPTDITATLLGAFGAPPTGFGRDLTKLTRDEGKVEDAPRLAEDGRGFQLAWGQLRLTGLWGKPPALKTTLSAEDQRATQPFAYLAAWGIAVEQRSAWLASRTKGAGREPATIDAATQAALDSWEKEKK